jgi:hypothetical protein
MFVLNSIHIREVISSAAKYRIVPNNRLDFTQARYLFMRAEDQIYFNDHGT